MFLWPLRRREDLLEFREACDREDLAVDLRLLDVFGFVPALPSSVRRVESSLKARLSACVGEARPPIFFGEGCFISISWITSLDRATLASDVAALAEGFMRPERGERRER